MKIVISSGHGKHIRGATGSPVPPQLDERNENVRVADRTAEILNDMGHQAIVFHDDVSTTQSENLNRIVAFHNAQGPHDLDVSVHFNAFDGSAHGCEVLYVSSAGQAVAKTVVDAICAASGFTNRGPKKRTDLAFLNGTNEVAVLIETCFCDNTSDCNTYRAKFEEICAAIAESIAGEAVEPGPPTPTTDDEAIMAIAMESDIAGYSWKDRGRAPDGYIKGFALSWAQVCRKFAAGDPAVLEMAKADTHDDDHDALSWYRSRYAALGMSNQVSGIDTLRHLYALLLGHGMRESSGEHCCGRDQSASNVSADTAEAGLYQTSYNAHSCSAHFVDIMQAYEAGDFEGYREQFAEGVSCSAADWENYGSGVGRDFQALCKEEPAFAVESCAIVLRNLRQHYGPINRYETELRADADVMLLDVQRYVLPEAPPAPDDDLEARVAELELAVEDLDRRVTALERQPQAAAAKAKPPAKKKSAKKKR